MHRKSVLRTFQIVTKYAIKGYFTSKLCKKKKIFSKIHFIFIPMFVGRHNFLVVSIQPKAEGKKNKNPYFFFHYYFAIKKLH